MRLTALDLFCGAGGLTRGLVESGFKVVAAVDKWEPAVHSYDANFPDHPVWKEDVVRLDRTRLRKLALSEPVDLVAGSPPCQGFSIQRIGKDEDDRNDLVLAFGRLVRELAPSMFLMENVPGLLGRRGKTTAARFVREMSAGGYESRSAILDAACFGVPQTRRRVFFVGWRQGLLSNFTFPEPLLSENQFLTVREAIGDLPSPPKDFSPMLRDPLHRRMRLSPKNLERLALIPPGGGFEDLPLNLRVGCHRNGATRIGHRYVYGRLDPDRPAGTITARFDSFTRGRFAHPWENRNISLREGARLQSFPDDHVFFGTQEEIAAQIGNAIPPLLARAVCGAVLRHIHPAETTDATGQAAFVFDAPEPFPLTT